MSLDTSTDGEKPVVQLLSAKEVASSLWSKSASEKCRLGITDSVIYDRAVPARWYITGKGGEVLKKRSVDKDSLRDRWLRIAEQNSSGVVAVIRQKGNILKFLNIDAWETFTDNLKVPDDSILSIHCFVKSKKHTIYRNNFEVKDRTGRFVTTTYCYSYSVDEEDPETVTVFHEDTAKVYECKAANINAIMDLATNTIIKYVEMMLSVKVLSISVDYVIDSKSQLWMLWTSPAKVLVSGVLLADALSSLPSGDRRGRMGWAGPKYFEAENEARHLAGKEEISTPKQKPLGNISFDAEPMHLDVGLASSQINSASGVVDAYAQEQADGGRKKGRHKALSPRNLYQHTEDDTTHNGLSQYPNPFKCKGDYCSVFVRPVGGHAPDSNYKEHTVEKYFSAKELAVLRKNRQFSRMMDFSAVNGPALAAITNRSLILAKQELRCAQAEESHAEDWRVYPGTPRQNSAQLLRQSVNLATGDFEGGQYMNEMSAASKAEQELNKQLEGDKQHRHAFTRDMATYYEPVRVCNTCNKIYMVLDLAREILQKQTLNSDAKRSRSANLNTQSSPTNRDSESNRLPKSKSHSNLGSVGRPRSRQELHSKTVGEAGMTNTSAEGFPVNDESADDKKGMTHKQKVMQAMLEAKYGDGKVEEEVDPFARDGKRKTWKNYREKKVKKEAFDREKFANLDDYLRGGADAMKERSKADKDRLAVKRIAKLQEELKDTHGNPFTKNTASAENMYRGKVMVACEEGKAAVEAKFFLEAAFFEVRWVPDGVQVLNDLYDTEADDSKYDCLLIQLDLALNDAFAVTKNIRDQEKMIRRNAAAKAAAQGRGIQPPTRRLPVICFTSKTAPEDLQKYMKADMDGCLSMPPNKTSLVNTIRAAVPHHLAEVKGLNLAEYSATLDDGLPKPQKNHPKAFKEGLLGTLEGSIDSATAAAKQMSVAGSVGDSDPTQAGVVQIDADTRVPYMVMDFSKASKAGQTSSNRPFFNLIVCHDMFDTLERMKIFFKPIAQKYLGLQILLWNYPGQAFTEWRPEQLLNNEYHATCLNEVLGQVGENGTKDFDTSRPFYMLGYGHGTSILTYYASHYTIPNMRGLISINGWAFLDTYLAGVMHDCINVFQTAPPTRPDLPIYFFSRFLFSKEYLAKVSVPLALNLYTAVHNPISLLGRISLCKGVLQAVDVRPVLREIDCPVICLQSTQDSLTRPLHTEPFVLQRDGEVRSIFKVLATPKKTCVVWMKSGHELFQENKKQTQTLIEQILTGFHETHDISFPPAPLVDKGASVGTLVSSKPGDKDTPYNATVEDKFIDGILDNVKAVQGADQSQDLSKSGTVGRMRKFRTGSGNPTLDDPNSSWEDYAVSVAEGQLIAKPTGTHGAKSTSKSNLEDASQFMTYDPTIVSFEKQESATHSSTNKAIKVNKNSQNVGDYPEVKEYMGWRLKRNKKRLQRLQNAARTIQGGFRAHIARVFVSGIRRRKAASMIQRCFRGWLGRCAFLEQARRIWAALMIQRAYRGYQGRLWYFKMRLHIAAAATIQRYYRGYLARIFVNALNHQRFLAACKIQGIYRRNAARREAWNKRRLRNAATVVQRVFRGHLGKRKATAERDKYIFSKSQSQGIEFGRQMLLEHKLHATKLQSDVTLLTQEKVGAEEQVEALLEEITSFEEGVRILEKEMHQLAKVEVDAAAYMDEESKYELREQKMRLDREFGDMLGKISSRKDMLTDLEVKLSSIDKSRQTKEEELRTLERKLVVLLEEQQNELRAIKRKQDVRGALLAASHDQLNAATAPKKGGKNLQITDGSESGGENGTSAGAIMGGGGGGGPSAKEKKQAAQLMQSTETLMKFGFMSMSMTYFSSLNMIKAMRTVSAQDTVMAALSDVQSQRAANQIPGTEGGGSVGPGSVNVNNPDQLGGNDKFLPALKPGALPGQESLHVSSWSVEDCAKWLQTLSLGQYSEAFVDAAVDGEFLYDLNDDDLKNTLGVEHRLHRKKILNCVHRLKIAEAARDQRVGNMLLAMGTDKQPQLADEPTEHEFATMDSMQEQMGAATDQDRLMAEGPKIGLDELFSIVRHSKYPLLKEALDYLPRKDFDKSLVSVPYIEDNGTAYKDAYEKLSFHINKADEHGNTMLTLACQNGNVKVSKFLISKGANPNHQNNQGQSPGHFAVAYQFFDLSTWLFANGASDTVENKFGLTPYDGLSPEG